MEDLEHRHLDVSVRAHPSPKRKRGALTGRWRSRLGWGLRDRASHPRAVRSRF